MDALKFVSHLRTVIKSVISAALILCPDHTGDV